MMLKIYLKMLLKRVCNRNNYTRSTPRTLSLFFVLGVSWVQIWQYGSKVYFCQKYYSYNDYKPIHVSHIEAFYGPNFKCES